MSGKFNWVKFKDIDLSDEFFDLLKQDYAEFSEWFTRKANAGQEALVYQDNKGIGAFLYLKEEQNESIKLEDNKVLPACRRIKIGTLRLSERQRGIRLGEGAIGVALWKWQESKAEEIYVTVFEKHELLINLFKKYGFACAGKNERGECIYVKNRNNIDYSNPYKAFPFINSNIEVAGMLPINEKYHDRLFTYSELKGNKKEIEEITAGNGITKIYIAMPSKPVNYIEKEPIFIYRKHDGDNKMYKSAITSFCTITNIIKVKENGRYLLSFSDFIKTCSNKTVFLQYELHNIYHSQSKNIIILEMIYNGFFGKGHNIIYKTLKENGLFEVYPYQIKYTYNDFKNILEMGDVDVQNVIIN